MSDKDYQIEYSNINERSQTPYLMDYVPDQLIKVYPYRAIKGNKNKPFIQTLTASIIRLSQDVEDYSQLQFDENGIKFIEMFAAWDDQTKVTVTSGAETFQQDIRKLRTYTALFNNFFTTDDDKPDFFTIGEPFNNAKYKKGEQRVYYGSNFQPSAQELIVDLIDQGYNVDEETRLAEITMQDVAVLEEQYSKSVLLFTLDGNLMLNPTVTYNSKREGKQVTKPGVRLKTNSYSLINSIKAKGELDFGNFKAPFADIDFYTEHLFSPLKMSPDKVTDKVTMFADWFDYTLTMPYFVAKHFNTENGNTIQDLLQNSETFKIGQDAFVKVDTYIPPQPDGSHKDDFFKKDGEYTLNFTGESIKWQRGIELTVQDINNMTFNFGPISFYDKQGSYEPSALYIDTINFSDYNIVKNNDNFELRNKSDNTNVTNVIYAKAGVHNLQFKLRDFWIKIDAATGAGQVHFRLTDVVEQPGEYYTPVWHSPSGWKFGFSASKKTRILQDEDIMLIEDMILISSGFKDNWKKAPRDKDHPEKIDPLYRVGHKGIRIQNIADKKPADIIDGLVLEHEDTYPSFRTTPERYLIFRSIVNALSKYIVSNTYTTNQGFNELNAITLPWFLMLAPSEKDANKIEYWTNKHNVNVTEFGTTEAKPSYLLNGTQYNDNNVRTSFTSIKWATYSSYFTKTFSQLNDYTFKKGINLTDKLNLSGTKVVETDRKVILPELKDTIAENDKINVPGQNTGTADYLSNYFYLPLSSHEDIEKIFFNGLTNSEILEPGAKIIVNVPRTPDGVEWDRDKVRDYIHTIYSPDKIEVINDSDISINKVLSFSETLNSNDTYGRTENEGGLLIKGSTDRGRIWYPNKGLKSPNLPDSNGKNDVERFVDLPDWYIKQRVAEDFGYSANYVEIPSGGKAYARYTKHIANSTTNVEGQYMYGTGMKVTVNYYHSEFEPITITVKPGVHSTAPLSTPRLVNRQTYFDKTEWMKFTDTYLMPLGQMIDLYIVSEGDTKINWLEELTIMSVWGDEMRLSCDGMSEELIFTLPSVSDETIAVQRIVII